MALAIESIYDAHLNISTMIEDGDERTEKGIYNAYEVTSYFFLERFFQAFPFAEGDHLVDFGCGKGRVLFMASQYSCKHVTGYENNNKRFETLRKNVGQYQQKHGTDTVFNINKENAQSAVIDDTANKFFFFEPFHLKIYTQVFDNIIKSLSQAWRDITIVMYLPHESTLKYLDTIPGFKKEIFVDSTLYYQSDPLISIPYYALYCNYSMEDMVDPYFLIC